MCWQFANVDPSSWLPVLEGQPAFCYRTPSELRYQRPLECPRRTSVRTTDILSASWFSRVRAHRRVNLPLAHPRHKKGRPHIANARFILPNLVQKTAASRSCYRVGNANAV